MLGNRESLEYENNLLKPSLTSWRTILAGKVEDSGRPQIKNFEVTNLEVNNVALSEEIKFLRNELDTTKARLGENETVAEQLGTMQDIINSLGAERPNFYPKLKNLVWTSKQWTKLLQNLNSKVAGYEAEMEGIMSGASKWQSRMPLLGQVVQTNRRPERWCLNLLSEREKMAEQLLKMNE